MSKPTKPITVHTNRPDNVFWIYLGKKRYDLFMSKPPLVFIPDYKQLNLLKNGTRS